MARLLHYRGVTGFNMEGRKMDIGYEGISIRSGIHMALIYHNVDMAIKVFTKVLAVGLKVGHKCFFGSSPEKAKALKSSLVSAGVDVEKAIKEGTLQIVTDRNELLPDGKLDPDGLIAMMHGFIKEALEIGERPARVIMDMSWIAGGVSGNRQLLEYEAKAGELFNNPDMQVLGLCAYSMSDLQSDDLYELIEYHPITIIGENLRFNPHYGNYRESDD